MMKAIKTTLLLLTCAPVFAQEDLPSAADEGAFGCKSNIHGPDFVFEPSRHFSDVQEEAVRISNIFCQALNDPVSTELPVQELADFGLLARSRAVQKFAGTSEEKGVTEAMGLFAQTIDSGGNFPALMPDFDVDKPAMPQPGVEVFYSVSVTDENLHEVRTETNGDCMATSSVKCSDLLLDLSYAIDPYKRSYQISNAEKVEAQLTVLHNEWNSFFDNARSMTTIDLVLTSWIEKGHMRKGYLVGPIKRQWFALHPNMILQYAGDAPSGDKFEPGLSIEWLGVNYWQDGPFGVPMGASLTTVYSDRANFDSVGHGVTLHFDNRYTIGWTKHGSDDAYHVSVDLLEFFQEKQSEFDKYKQKILSLK